MALELFANFERSSNGSVFYRNTSSDDYTVNIKLSDTQLLNGDYSTLYYAKTSLNGGPFGLMKQRTNGTYDRPLGSFDCSNPCVCSISVNLFRLNETEPLTTFTLSAVFLNEIPTANFILYPKYQPYLDGTNTPQMLLLSAENYNDSLGTSFYGEGHTELFHLSSNFIDNDTVASWFVGNLPTNINNPDKPNSDIPLIDVTKNTAYVSITSDLGIKAKYPVSVFYSSPNIPYNSPIVKYNDLTGEPEFYPYFASTLTVNNNDNPLNYKLKDGIKVEQYPEINSVSFNSPFSPLKGFNLPFTLEPKTFLSYLTVSASSSFVSDTYLGSQWSIEANSDGGGWGGTGDVLTNTPFLPCCYAYNFQLAYDNIQNSILDYFKASPLNCTTVTVGASSFKEMLIELPPYDWKTRTIAKYDEDTADIYPVPYVKLYTPNYFNLKGQPVKFEIINSIYDCLTNQEGYNLKCLQITSNKSSEQITLFDYPLSGTLVFDKIGKADLQITAVVQNAAFGYSDTYANNSVLVLHGNGINGSDTIYDSSVYNNEPIDTDSKASISTYVLRNGTGSIYFNSYQDCRISYSPGTNFAYGTNPFTIECWIYSEQFTNTTGVIYSQSASGNDYLTISIDSNGNINWKSNPVGLGSSFSTPLTSITKNYWNHLAFVREGISTGQAKIYLNGTLAVTGTCPTNFDNVTYNPTIGGYNHNTTNNFHGYIDDFRITKGIARYTSNFIPPAENFTDKKVLIDSTPQTFSVILNDMIEIVEKYDDKNEYYYQTSLTKMKLPYTTEPKISPNEWVTEDTFNGAIKKIYDVAQTIEKFTKLYQDKSCLYGWIGVNDRYFQTSETPLASGSIVTASAKVWETLECPPGDETEVSWMAYECSGGVAPINLTWDFNTNINNGKDVIIGGEIYAYNCFQKYCMDWKWATRKKDVGSVNVNWKDSKLGAPYEFKWRYEKCDFDSNDLNCHPQRSKWRLSNLDSEYFPINDCATAYRCKYVGIDYVQKTNHLVVAYPTEIQLAGMDYEMTYLGRRGRADDLLPFQNIVGIDLGVNDEIFVLDSALSKVSIFQIQNNEFRLFGSWGSFGYSTTSSGLNKPQDIHVDQNNTVWIADTGNKCVKKFSFNGRNLGVISHSRFNTNHPLSMCVDSKTNVHVLINGSVLVFDYEGSFLFEYSLTSEAVNPKKINTSFNRETIYIVYDTGIVKYFRTGTIAYYIVNNHTCADKKTMNGFYSLSQDRYRNLYVTSQDKILKIPDLMKLVDVKASLPIDLYWDLNDILIHKEEYVQPWVYVRSFHRLWDNIEILRGSLFYEETGCKKPTSAIYQKEDLIIGQNELVTNAVINRLLSQVWRNLKTLFDYFDPLCEPSITMNKQLEQCSTANVTLASVPDSTPWCVKPVVTNEGCWLESLTSTPITTPIAASPYPTPTPTRTPTPTPSTPSLPSGYPWGLIGPTTKLIGTVYQLPTLLGRLYTEAELASITPTLSIGAPAFNVTEREFTSGFPGSPTLTEKFQINFIGRLEIPVTGTYEFKLLSDDGAKFYIGNDLIVNGDGAHSLAYEFTTVSLSAAIYDIKMEFYQATPFFLALQLLWKKPGSSFFTTVPAANFLPPVGFTGTWPMATPLVTADNHPMHIFDTDFARVCDPLYVTYTNSTGTINYVNEPYTVYSDYTLTNWGYSDMDYIISFIDSAGTNPLILRKDETNGYFWQFGTVSRAISSQYFAEPPAPNTTNHNGTCVYTFSSSYIGSSLSISLTA